MEFLDDDWVRKKRMRKKMEERKRNKEKKEEKEKGIKSQALTAPDGAVSMHTIISDSCRSRLGLITPFNVSLSPCWAKLHKGLAP